MGTLQKSESADTDAQPKRKLRVFLVEDLPVVRNRVIESLQEIKGVVVSGFAESEDSAVSWLGSHACDVLILDLQLRQGNGLGVLKALADRDPSSRLLKIVYSNHVSATIRKLASQFGAAYFFDKTLDTPKLRLLLEDLSAAAV
jgi:DNA-binding NarL/FixJ family response regulator